MYTEKIRFKSDGLYLTGILHLPDMKHAPVVIGSHGLMADRRSPKQRALALACNRLGMAFFRFDHRGCGESEGTFDDGVSLKSRCNDLQGAAEVLSRRLDLGSSLGLFGSSFGGTVCMAMGAKLNAAAMVIYAAPLRSRTLFRIPELPVKSRCAIDPAQVKRWGFDISQMVPQLHHILIIHGTKDEVVPIEDAKETHRLAGSPKKMIILENGDHRMSSAAHRTAFIDSASRWLKAGLS